MVTEQESGQSDSSMELTDDLEEDLCKVWDMAMDKVNCYTLHSTSSYIAIIIIIIIYIHLTCFFSPGRGYLSSRVQGSRHLVGCDRKVTQSTAHCTLFYHCSVTSLHAVLYIICSLLLAYDFI